MTASVSQAYENILDGKAISSQLTGALTEQVARLKADSKPLPKLVVIIVGDDAASQVYVKRKAKVAHQIGMDSDLICLPVDTSQTALLEQIETLNNDTAVNAILVQLPLPKHLDENTILNSVLPAKDVDGFHPVNLGRLLSGDLPPALPCTPKGMMTMLEKTGVDLSGKHAVVVGRSTIVGKPMAQLLLNANATVTICHSKTQNLPQVCKQADILVAAVGRPEMITADYVKDGAVVLDVGINRTKDGKLVGDVDFGSVQPKAAFITPVPGGVGPMTIATLMQNTLALYQAQQNTNV